MRYSLFPRFGLLAVLLSLPCWALPPTATTCALPATAMFGVPVTIGIAVTGDSGLTPTGSVRVIDNGIVVVGASSLALDGTAKLTAVFNLGLHLISCSYLGDGMLAPSASGASFLTTVQAHPTIVLTLSQNPVPAGQRVQIDIIVAGIMGAPEGGVTLRDGDSILAVLLLRPNDNSSTASFSGILTP